MGLGIDLRIVPRNMFTKFHLKKFIFFFNNEVTLKFFDDDEYDKCITTFFLPRTDKLKLSFEIYGYIGS